MIHAQKTRCFTLFVEENMASQISINGTVTRGMDVRQQNVMAVSAISNIVKVSVSLCATKNESLSLF